MGHRSVDEVMSHRLVCVLEHTSFKEIVRILAGNHLDLVPVVDGDRRVVGVVTSADVLARFGARLHSRTHYKRGCTAAELMSAPPITTTPQAGVEDATRLAVHERVRELPVVDRYGVLLGVVSRTELATVFLRPDDEIADDVRHVLALRPSAAGAARVGVRAACVAVSDGVVTLTGRVPSSAAGRRLADASRRIPGVVAVRDEFDVEARDGLLPMPR